MSAPTIYFDLGNTLVWGPTGNKSPFPEAVATVLELYNRGYRIGILSDQPTGTSLADMVDKLTGYGLDPTRFDVMVISSETSPAIYKPAQAIFDRAVAKAGFTTASQQMVFVTETLTHIQAARAFGWRAIHVPFDSSCTPLSGECIASLDDLLAKFPPLHVDVFIRDAPDDPGHDDYNGWKFWNSPDMWIRHSPDNQLAHQAPEAGQPNTFYTRIHNRGVGIVRTVTLTWAVQTWAGTQFVYPDDYWPFIALATASNIEPGGNRVVMGTWPANQIPTEGTHVCWLVSAHTMGDHPTTGRHVWQHNNLAQKNLIIVDLVAGDSKRIPIVVGNRSISTPRRYQVELHRSPNALTLPVGLFGRSKHTLARVLKPAEVNPETIRRPELEPLKLRVRTPTQLHLGDTTSAGLDLNLEAGSTLSMATVPQRVLTVEHTTDETHVVFADKPSSTVRIRLASHQCIATELQIDAPLHARTGEVYRLDLVQRSSDGTVVGGVAVQVQIIEPPERRKTPLSLSPEPKTLAQMRANHVKES